MKQRALTAVILAAIFIPLLTIDKMFIPFQIALSALAMLAIYELFEMFETTHQVNWFVKVAVYLLTLGYFVIIGNVWHETPNLGLSELKTDISLIFMVALLVMFALTIFIPTFDGKVLGMALLIINYVGLGFGSIVVLRLLGTRFIVYLFMITILTDTFAYLFGIKFGKHKMAPLISPKKTWEGAIAGTVIASVIGIIFALLYGKIFPPGGFLNINKGSELTILDGITGFGTDELSKPILWKQAFIIVPLTILVSIVGQIGDLFASKLKRTYGIKDFGNLFPGHGGVLDRFDSGLFAALFLVVILQLLGIAFPVS